MALTVPITFLSLDACGCCPPPVAAACCPEGLTAPTRLPVEFGGLITGRQVLFYNATLTAQTGRPTWAMSFDFAGHRLTVWYYCEDGEWKSKFFCDRDPDAELAEFYTHFPSATGDPEYDPAFDFDSDGDIDSLDLFTFLANLDATGFGDDLDSTACAQNKTAATATCWGATGDFGFTILGMDEECCPCCPAPETVACCFDDTVTTPVVLPAQVTGYLDSGGMFLLTYDESLVSDAGTHPWVGQFNYTGTPEQGDYFDGEHTWIVWFFCVVQDDPAYAIIHEWRWDLFRSDLGIGFPFGSANTLSNSLCPVDVAMGKILDTALGLFSLATLRVVQP